MGVLCLRLISPDPDEARTEVSLFGPHRDPGLEAPLEVAQNTRCPNIAELMTVSP